MVLNSYYSYISFPGNFRTQQFVPLLKQKPPPIFIFKCVLNPNIEFYFFTTNTIELKILIFFHIIGKKIEIKKQPKIGKKFEIYIEI